ncbi:glycine cleavage system aminomethyltransferase GcvT [Aestuariivirga sp.]|uniref:glycine cleavage system aminomethyltransferase GcvT n=1 Tax=Aestuariivirga sp. TaxID=2650926 RepID=UPI0039E40C45
MVPFAGYEMPVQYPTGILTEHTWTRDHAGLFDVSHMGQCLITGSSFEQVAAAMESLVPADILGLAPQQQRYSQLLADDGGILDDLMITRSVKPGELYVVVNAACKEADFAHIAGRLPVGITLTRLDHKALLALQGPEAEAVLASLSPAVRDIAFMSYQLLDLAGIKGVHVSRSGYTGEDGFELSLDAGDVVKLWTTLLADERVKPIGLGARDSLRLEGGLCLYGHDIDTTTSPIEAGLTWSIAKRRREEGGFPGHTRIKNELTSGLKRVRVGIKPDGRLPAREGSIIQNAAGREIGKVTSGGFGPTVNGPVAMGYVDKAHSAAGTPLFLVVRDKAIPASVVKLPFVPNRFKR